jgi:hypothetical protein
MDTQLTIEKIVRETEKSVKETEKSVMEVDAAVKVILQVRWSLFSRHMMDANTIYPQRLKSGEMYRPIGFGSTVLTSPQVLLKDFATKRHHTKLAFRRTVIPTAACRALV